MDMEDSRFNVWIKKKKNLYIILVFQKQASRNLFHTSLPRLPSISKGINVLFLLSDLVAVFPLEQYRFETVSPEDFRSQIGAAALRCHRCGLHHPLKYDHHLQFRVILQGFFVYLEKRWLFIDFVHYSHRRDQKDAIGASIKTHVDVCVVEWQILPLWCHPWLKTDLGKQRKSKYVLGINSYYTSNSRKVSKGKMLYFGARPVFLFTLPVQRFIFNPPMWIYVALACRRVFLWCLQSRSHMPCLRLDMVFLFKEIKMFLSSTNFDLKEYLESTDMRRSTQSNDDAKTLESTK